MGTLKKYIGAYGFESMQLSVGDSITSEITCIPFKTTAGASITQSYYIKSKGCGTAVDISVNNVNLRNLIPKATADILDNFDVNDYTAINVVSVNYTTNRILTENNCQLVYAITLTNNDTVAQTVSCIKFVKNFLSSYRTSDCTPTYSNALCYGYFLDTPITLQPNDTSTITVNFEIKVE